jgi:NAD(P)-dependent dehydrogenase (short-subunit alcohol dehydrogenase family)
MTEDAVVLITGAAGGLGRTMALGLLAAGRRVVGFDVIQTPIEHERFFSVVGSVRSERDCEEAVAKAIAHFGAVHALVNNAGLSMGIVSLRAMADGVKFYDVPVEGWRTLIDTNVNGPFLMARAVAPHLVAQKWGRIVNVVTSYTTMLKGAFTPYGPSKAALEAATVSWAEDLDGTGVTVNALLPGGAADTPMVPVESVSDRSKLVRPAVMVEPIKWLTSHASDGITGRRFIGKDWNPAAAPDQNLKTAGALAGWR